MNENILLYERLFWVCLLFSVVCLMIALYVFWKFHILSTLGYLTGRNEKKKIKELEQTIKHFDVRTSGRFTIIQEIMLLHTEEQIGEGGNEK